VFSGDRRSRGYIVKSAAEELKIKSFLKMFYFAHFYILVFGMMLANSWSTFVVHLEGMSKPIEHMARNVGIALAVYCAVMGLPYFFLWRSYKKALPSFVSSQDQVVVSGQSRRQQQWKLILVISGLALLVMGVGLALLVRAK
jgi:cytochrome c biogenesis protein CcdA